jgi:hypothetical protein
MAALATVEDAASFGYLLDPVTGPGFLNRASERIRAYSGQDISRVVADVVNVPVRNNQALLPQLPADKPTLVQIDGVTFLENTAWYWDPIQWRVMGIDPFIPSANFTGWWRETDGERYITVTYSHGFVTVPDTIKEIVCAVAFRMAQTPGAAEGGTRQEATAAVTITYASETLAAGASLTASEKGSLDLVIPRRRRISSPMRTY